MGRHLFERVIGRNGLLREKTRILVSHQISILPNVDHIIVLKDGSTSESGTFDELIARKGDFAEFVTEYLFEESDSDLENGEIDVINKLKEKMKPITNKTIDQSISGSVQSASVEQMSMVHIKSSPSVVNDKDFTNFRTEEKSISKVVQKTNGKLTEAEASETGSVKLKVYKNYIYLIGFGFNFVILSSFIVSNVAQVLTGLWLSEWSNDSLDSNKTKDTNLRDLRLGVYAGIGIFESIFSIIANISVSIGCIKASEKLHNLMIQRVIKAPMSFFGTKFN